MKKKLLSSFFVVGLFLNSCEKVEAIENMINPVGDLPENKVVLITDVTIHGKGYVYYNSPGVHLADSCSKTTIFHISDTVDVNHKNFIMLNVQMRDSATVDYSIKAYRNMVYFEIESGRVVNESSIIINKNLELTFLAKIK